MTSKMWPICLFAIFIGSVGSELVMTVLPDEVVPGVTPAFTLRCAMAEASPGIVSLQIKRATQMSHRHLYETLATLNASSLNNSVVTATMPNMRAHGFLNRPGGGIHPMHNQQGQMYPMQPQHGQMHPMHQQMEIIPYIEITFQNPSINDLGTYVCDSMIIGEMGQAVPMSAFISVTTSDPVSDRMLHLLHTLQTQLQGLVGQMAGTPNGGQGQGQGQRKHAGSGNEGRRTGGEGQTKTTSTSTNIPEAVVVHIHVFENVSYVLWESTEKVNADQASEYCANAGLYMTEINSEAEFRQVVRGLGTFIPVSTSVLLGGQRQDRWLWPHTGSQIDFMRGINRASYRSCLAMKKVSQYRMVMDAVNCDAWYRFYLCSVDEPILL